MWIFYSRINLSLCLINNSLINLYTLLTCVKFCPPVIIIFPLLNTAIVTFLQLLSPIPVPLPIHISLQLQIPLSEHSLKYYLIFTPG